MKTNILLILLTFAFLVIRILPYLEFYSKPFNKDLMYTKYYQSQWIIPQSKNPISDEDLYQVAGYDLVQTGIHFKINPEVPPLGKYLFGWSILLFNNPLIISYILFVLSVFIFYQISGFLLKNVLLKFAAVLLFIIDPLLYSLSYMSLLDLPQLFFLLLHILILFMYIREKKPSITKNIVYAVALGITFGAFSAVKIALLSGVIVIADSIILFRLKKLPYILILLPVSGVTYILTYLTYFIQGNSIIDLLKAQKWMFTFYAISKAEPVYGTVFTSLFTGYIKGWHEGASWDRVKEWSILWPVFISSFIILIISNFKKLLSNNYLIYTVLLTFGLLGMYIIIPFFARYLALVLPLLILSTLYLIESKFFKNGN